MNIGLPKQDAIGYLNCVLFLPLELVSRLIILRPARVKVQVLEATGSLFPGSSQSRTRGKLAVDSASDNQHEEKLIQAPLQTPGTVFTELLYPPPIPFQIILGMIALP
jgi:hypothetical protein